ncbi:MAG: LysR family transcriptional regulator [Lachnospiraceae bacterium]|nr:LysR family transcriptional regulator [Lachnospiraceae bacterium]
MTILQLKYVIAVASSTSMREAANRLIITQPALSLAINDLEEELGIVLFNRTNRGISLTNEGEEFLIYAKQAVSQFELIEDKYEKNSDGRRQFSVSLQHYVFAIHAFVNTIKKFDSEEYNYSIHETRTDEVLNDVKTLKSEIGIISYSSSNEKIIRKLLKEYQLKFVPIMTKNTYVYVWKKHPLADREELSLADLEGYPCVSFDQSSDNNFYLSEEALSNYDFKKIIKSTDRATSAELMVALNGYSIGTGIMIESFSLKSGFNTIKLKEEDPLTIGYIVKENHSLSEIGETYVEELAKYKE